MSSDLNSDSRTSEAEEEWFEIREVIAERVSRRNKKKKEYRVSWAPNQLTGEQYASSWVSREDLTESAFEAWLEAKKSKKRKRQKGSSDILWPAVQDQQTERSQARHTKSSKEEQTDSSQPVAPAHRRKRPRLQQYSSTPDLSPARKARRIESTSTSDSDEPAPAVSRQLVFTIDIRKRQAFDPSEYWSVPDSQNTSEAQSQPISTLESEDAQIFLVSETVIPDSQEWDSIPLSSFQQLQEHRQQQYEEEEHRNLPSEIPDSQEPSSLGSQQSSRLESLHNTANVEQSTLLGIASGSLVPSHQPNIGIVSAPEPVITSSSSSNLGDPPRRQSTQRLTPAPERVSASALLASFVREQLSGPFYVAEAARGAVIAPIARSVDAQSSLITLSSPSQAAQIIPASPIFYDRPRPNLSSQGESFVPDSVGRPVNHQSSTEAPSSIRQRPPARPVSSSLCSQAGALLPSSQDTMEDRVKSPSKQSATDLLRLALDPSLSGPLNHDDVAPAETAANQEVQAPISDTMLSLDSMAASATLQQPIIQINSPPQLNHDPILSAHTQPPAPSHSETIHDPTSLHLPLHLDAPDSADTLRPFMGTDGSADPFPATVSPSDISRPMESDLPTLDLGADVMDIGLNDPELENALPGSSRSQEEDADAEMAVNSSDFLVTLQLPANVKELYVDTYNHEKRAIDQFTQLQMSAKPVDPSVVAKIDDLMDGLFRICDLPDTLSKDTILQLPAKDIAKHAMGTNSKLCFVGRFFDKLTTANKKKVLVVARSQELVGYLEAIVSSIGDIAYSKTSLEDVGPSGAQPYDDKESGLAVVLARADQDVEDLANFDVIIAYDASYSSSKVAYGLRISDDYPADKKRPVVLTLVNTYTIEHFDLALSKDLDPMERRSAMLYALCSSRTFLLHFEDELTVEAAASLFAEHILDQDLISLSDGWRPQEVPQIFLEYYEASQRSQTDNDNTNTNKPNNINDQGLREIQAEGPAAELAVTEDSTSAAPDAETRKRKLEDAEDGLSKRLRGPDSPKSLGNSELQNINEVVHSQLLSLPPVVQGSKPELDGFKATISSLETQLKEKVDSETLMRKQITRMSTQIKSHENTINIVQQRLMDALLERGTALDNAKKAEEIAQTRVAELKASKDKYAALEEKYRSVIDTRGDEDRTFAQLTDTEKKLAESEAKISALEQRLKNKDSELDYVRDVFQTERQSSGQMIRENEELRIQVAKLQEEKSATRVKIQEINAANNTVELARQVTEAQVIARDREIELDRVKEELKALKNGRRETRGASVPRSPRMGMMSPRTGRGGVVVTGPGASRGTSPALGGIDGQTGAPPAVPGSQFFNPPSSNGRYNHLRDFV